MDKPGGKVTKKEQLLEAKKKVGGMRAKTLRGAVSLRVELADRVGAC